ncbi:MAG: DNA alkylation repair protein [Planctomycetes bacterium]|nr:DNA alkylation repair protein [Planctomycetota bacterium]
MEYFEIINKLKSLANPKNVASMARFGINPHKTLGVFMPRLRALAKQTGKNHSLARQLWASGIHEARILAGLVDESEKVTEKQMDKWARDFDSWDVCDGSCMNLFDRLEIAPKKAVAWSERKEEFVKRAGFALMACLAWHRKDAKDKEFTKFLPIIKQELSDNRNFVRKAVSWALRQIGKRSLYLNKQAVATAKEIQKTDSGAARWIASDAIRELTSQAVQKRLRQPKH